jgi:hypothetical protein
MSHEQRHSTPGAKFMGIDLKDFYLNHPYLAKNTSASHQHHP